VSGAFDLREVHMRLEKDRSRFFMHVRWKQRDWLPWPLDRWREKTYGPFDSAEDAWKLKIDF
jgi:hypothetical protein